jgi:hypothetical protein
MKIKQPQSLNEFKERVNPASGANKTDLPDNSIKYVRALRELRGKFRGKGLMEELMAEKRREKRTK